MRIILILLLTFMNINAQDAKEEKKDPAVVKLETQLSAAKTPKAKLAILTEALGASTDNPSLFNALVEVAAADTSIPSGSLVDTVSVVIPNTNTSLAISVTKTLSSSRPTDKTIFSNSISKLFPTVKKEIVEAANEGATIPEVAGGEQSQEGQAGETDQGNQGNQGDQGDQGDQTPPVVDVPNVDDIPTEDEVGNNS